MIFAILAGIMISIGALINLKVGGVAGAVFFSVGLLSILHFGLNLFTGKAGLLIQKKIKWYDLLLVYTGNLAGTGLMAILYRSICPTSAVIENAEKILAIRVGNPWYVNIFFGILCGILMYVAVTGYKETKNAIFVVFPVAAFILGGFNHCVADMFYTFVCFNKVSELPQLLFTTIGNLIGCSLIPGLQILKEKMNK